MGGKVTETVRTKITDYKSFEGEEDLLMLGMFTSIVAATVWLYWAAKFEIPISSAHSIIGGIVGFVFVAKGSDAIEWSLLGFITIFWVISPCLVACISIAFFVPMRTYLLRREDSWEKTLQTWPLFVIIVTWICSIFLLSDAYGLYHAMWMSLVIGIIMAAILYLVVIRTGFLERYCIEQVAKDEQQKLEREQAT
jgi:phosphate/sulfate permease